MKKEMWDRPVVVVSGASSGIGRALCYRLVKRGYRVAGIARRKSLLEEIAKELNIEQHKVFFPIHADVSDPAEAEMALQLTHNYWGQIDWIIANAGFGVIGDVGQLKWVDYQRQLDVNFFGVFHLIHSGLYFVRNQKGCIAIIGSINSYIALPGNSAYSASKFMLRGFSDSLREEELRNGVSVTFVAPGFVKTNIRRVDNFNHLIEQAIDPVPQWMQVSASAAARRIERAIRGRRRQLIIGFYTRVAIWLSRVAPSLVTRIIRKYKIVARPQPTAVATPLR